MIDANIFSYWVALKDVTDVVTEFIWYHSPSPTERNCAWPQATSIYVREKPLSKAGKDFRRQHLYNIWLHISLIYSLLAIIFFAVVCSLNPFLNLRVRVFMYLMRPVPTVLLPLAFSPQLKFLIFFAGYPQLEHVFFWMWYEILPQRRQAVWDLLCLFPNEVVPLVC